MSDIRILTYEPVSRCEHNIVRLVFSYSPSSPVGVHRHHFFKIRILTYEPVSRCEHNIVRLVFSYSRSPPVGVFGEVPT